MYTLTTRKLFLAQLLGEKTLPKALVHSRTPPLMPMKSLPEAVYQFSAHICKQKFRAETLCVAWGNRRMPAETHAVRLDCESHRDLQRPNPLDITLKQINVFQKISG